MSRRRCTRPPERGARLPGCLRMHACICGRVSAAAARGQQARRPSARQQRACIAATLTVLPCLPAMPAMPALQSAPPPPLQQPAGAVRDHLPAAEPVAAHADPQPARPHLHRAGQHSSAGELAGQRHAARWHACQQGQQQQQHLQASGPQAAACGLDNACLPRSSAPPAADTCAPLCCCRCSPGAAAGPVWCNGGILLPACTGSAGETHTAAAAGPAAAAADSAAVHPFAAGALARAWQQPRLASCSPTRRCNCRACCTAPACPTLPSTHTRA